MSSSLECLALGAVVDERLQNFCQTANIPRVNDDFITLYETWMAFVIRNGYYLRGYQGRHIETIYAKNIVDMVDELRIGQKRG